MELPDVELALSSPLLIVIGNDRGGGDPVLIIIRWYRFHGFGFTADPLLTDKSCAHKMVIKGWVHDVLSMGHCALRIPFHYSKRVG